MLRWFVAPGHEATYSKVFLALTDITDRVIAEKALENSRRDWENIFQAIGHPTLILDPQHRVIAANRVAVEKTGISPEELLHKHCYEVFHGTGYPPGSCPMERMMKSGQPQTLEMEFKALGGTFLVTCTPVFDDAGRLEKVIHIATDITDRKQTEEALRRSEQKYRSLYDNMRDGFVAVNLEGEIIEFNAAFQKLLQYRSEEIYNLTYKDITPTKWHPIEAQIIKDQVLPREYSDLYDKEYRRKDGSIFPVELRTYLIRDENGKSTGMWALIRDISNRKRWEAALQESEAKFRSFFDLSPQAAARAHFETGQVADVNQKFCELFKTPMEEILGRTMTELGLCTEKQSKIFVNRLNESDLVDGLEMDLSDRGGRIFTTLIFARLMQIKEDTDILIIFYDITERRKLRQHLQRAQRMEALGTLAGGIAHDFNNLLMGILGNASLMLSEMESRETHYEQLKNIESYVHSAAALTKQLLGFAQGGKYEVKPTNLNNLIERNARMFGRTKKEINIHKKFQEEIWAVEVDRGQIDQVLLNLFVNAWQAMPGGGQLYIQTANVLLDKGYVKPFEVRAGRYVKITITDTGVGMDTATQQRIFEPFFTTKEMGRGTGLGLASAYGIIKNHGGLIDVYSAKGKGTTFSIYLPVGEKGVAEKKDLDKEILRGKETILLVDDEELIIDIGQKLLAKMGYHPLTAQGGQEAIEVYRKNVEKIDLIILDMIMPDMNGQETYDNLKKLNPAVKVLLSSGYSLNDQARKIMASGCHGFIQKPFDAVKLSQKIRKICDNP
jgi:PAS domain S-box-containing protein